MFQAQGSWVAVDSGFIYLPIDEEAPFNVPLHPGARRFYRERGYSK